jgi:hypothetical protein
MTSSEVRFYHEGGALPPDAPSYVVRQADSDLYTALQQGQFCYVLTARQMGKSSLMGRVAARLREEGVAVARLDLTAIGRNVTPEQWYYGLLNRVGQQLDLEDELEAFWLEPSPLGPLQRWMIALRQVVLGSGVQVFRSSGLQEGQSSEPEHLNTRTPEHPSRLVIFIDEIDFVRSLPFSTDEFFAGIRECYNRRSEDPAFERLTFCLLGVATPSDLIQDVRTTPFNIGRRIELTDFGEVEAAPLARGLGSTNHEDTKDTKDTKGTRCKSSHRGTGSFSLLFLVVLCVLRVLCVFVVQAVPGSPAEEGAVLDRRASVSHAAAVSGSR